MVRSPLYETDPWGFDSDDRFLNLVISIDTAFNPDELLTALQKIEKLLGRERTSLAYESRPIDLDILFYNEEIINGPKLTIPHPLIQKRMFVLKPLLDISPDLIHPEFNESIKELEKKCDDKRFVRKLGTK